MNIFVELLGKGIILFFAMVGFFFFLDALRKDFDNYIKRKIKEVKK